ncbi:efflux RND transporter periplasmic adaptor subunit [Rheinheimera sp.]|uniref:efflux RND transporter periplasmic adaptor subunit n=1 Tax=Rheinheimera sp. TaxID=1869214 RepID=UPI00273592CA|nr:efflux RND transporter periplasmic adaptor subunit [Rheinheimera sp.]MDP2713705.1 efflux RND transporter periplasmic adaptor subunit [Rheinheimera sp.]
MNKIKAFFIAVVLLLVVFAVLAGVKANQIMMMIESGEQFVPPPESVSVTAVERQSWSNHFSATGTVLADEGVMISAEVSGKVKKISFKNGAYVEAGTVLLEQESGNEQAQLRAALARLTLAQQNYNRLLELRRDKIATQSEMDGSKQQLDSAQADVDSLRSTLEKKVLRAPFSGRLGIRVVDVGADLQPGSEVVSLQASNAVRVNFPVPQHKLKQIRIGLPVSVSINDAAVVLQGEVTAVAPELNSASRNAIVQSVLANKDNALVPGMAVAVKVTLAQPSDVLVVPATALIYAPYGDTVFIVEKAAEGEGLVARQQFVRLGASRGDFVEILDGVKAGDEVVTSGAFKLFNGQSVIKTDSPAPKYSTTPAPADA